LKITSIAYILLFLLLSCFIAGNLQQSTASAETVNGSTMINGVLAHQMTASEAQLLANANITWISCDVTFNPSDISQWSQIYSLAKQYHLSLMGILDQHLMNYSNTFTLNDWSNAVTQAVNVFGDVVKTWEIWNEPSMPDATLGYFDGSPQTYVAMLQTAYNDIKTAAPTDTVIGLGGLPLYTSDNPSLSNPCSQQALVWANQTVTLGGMNYCDAIAVHAYPYGQYYPQIAGSLFTSYLQQYEQLCPNKPIWVTEVGQESSSTTWAATQTQQSIFLSQSYSLFQSLGVKAYIWYELADNYTAIPDSNFGLFDNNGNQKQAFTTFVSVVNGPTLQTTPLPTPTGSPTPSPTANPTPTPPPSSSQPQHETPAPTASASATATAVPEENPTIALTTSLIMVLTAAISIYTRKFGPKK